MVDRAIRLHRLTCHTSACFRSQAHGLVSGQLSKMGRLEQRHIVPVSCCLSATGIRLLGILVPPRNRALLTVGLPAHHSHRTRTGLPCSARVSHGWGWMSSIPRGRRCPHGRECSTTAACRIATALSLSPRHCIPTRRVMLTRHQRGFPFSHPVPSLPLTCEPRTEQDSLGFPASFAPDRYRPRTSRWGQVSNTDPESRRRHQPTSNRRTHSSRAASCRKHYAYPPAFKYPITWPPLPCGRPSRPPW
jgi:hypothetical protein